MFSKWNYVAPCRKAERQNRQNSTSIFLGFDLEGMIGTDGK